MGKGIVSQDHQGKWYDSRKEMCDWWEIHDNTYQDRISRGYTVKEALTKEVAKPTKPSTDHKGNKFISERKMCEHYGISPGTFRDRLLRGWSLEEALSRKAVPQLNKRADRLGESKEMLNGLVATIIDYESAKSVTVLFEDGSTGHGSMGNFVKGKIGHPTLRVRGKGYYMGFDTEDSIVDKEDSYYKCVCQKCGVRDILTPQEMMEHYKVCTHRL